MNDLSYWFLRLKITLCHCNIDDPLDTKHVTISASKLSYVSGDGAFAKTDITGNTPYAVYSGQIFNNGDERKELISTQYSKIKQFMSTEEDSSKVIRYAESLNKFRCQPKVYPLMLLRFIITHFYFFCDNYQFKLFRLVSGCGQTIFIPGEYGDINLYRKSLGHKVNHSFEPNSEYQLLDSAR